MSALMTLTLPHGSWHFSTATATLQRTSHRSKALSPRTTDRLPTEDLCHPRGPATQGDLEASKGTVPVCGSAPGIATVPASLFRQHTAPGKSLDLRKSCVPPGPDASCPVGEKLFALHIHKQGNNVAKGHIRITHLSSRRAAQTPQHVYLLYVLQDTLWASFLQQWDHNSPQVTYLTPSS